VWRGPFKYGDLVSCQIQGKAISLGLVAVSWSQPVNEDSQAREVAVNPPTSAKELNRDNLSNLDTGRFGLVADDLAVRPGRVMDRSLLSVLDRQP
jgi:hypothetical protein